MCLVGLQQLKSCGVDDLSAYLGPWRNLYLTKSCRIQYVVGHSGWLSLWFLGLERLQDVAVLGAPSIKQIIRSPPITGKGLLRSNVMKKVMVEYVRKTANTIRHKSR